MRYVTRYIVGLIGIFALFSSCAKDPTDHYGGGVDEGQKVLVQLSVKIPSVNAPKETPLKGIDRRKFAVEFFRNEAPRTKSDGTTKLYNLWAFQFDAAGNINGTPQKISDEVTMVNDMAILDVTLTVATDQTLYLVVLGKKVTGNLAAIRSKKALESLPFDYLELNNGLYASRISSEDDVPFAGSIDGVSVKAIGDGSRGVIEYNKPEGFGGGIEIKRLVSRILLKQKFDLTENTLQGVRLLNVPTKVYINSAAISAEAMSYVDIDSPLLLTDKDSEGFYTTVWYVAPNLKGTNGISTENDRYRKVEGETVYGTAPEFGTNIEVWSYSNTMRNNYTVHQIYVGKNNTNNFDVEANTYYNLSTVVNSSDVSDGRIRAYTAKQQVYLTAFNRGYSSGQLGATNIYFDVHPGKRPVIIYTQGRNVNVGIFSDPACTVPVDMNNPLQNWLQLSVYPNYTEVARNKPNSLKKELSTDIILPTRLRFYLYCDEYLYNEDGTLPTKQIDTYKDLKERTLYVKVITTELGVEKPQKLEAKYTIKQRQGIYCGLFGGELKNGQYEKVLFMDNVDEFEFRYDDVYPKSIPFGSWSATPVFGYRNVFAYGITGNSAEDYKKLYNGKYQTIALSENTDPNNFPVASNTTLFPEMKKINGVIDLYQYDYYKTYAARFCYDLNRDEDGSGTLEADEIKWYLASPYQGLGMMAGFGKKTFPSSGTSGTTYNNMMTSALETSATDNYSVQETGYGSGSGTGNTGKLDGGKVVHCVREVDIPAGLKTTNQVGTTTVNGDTYAMLDLSDMPDGVTDRTQNLDKFYTNVELYTYSTSGELTDPTGGTDFSKPSLDNGGKQIMVRRVRKHGVSKTYTIVTDEIKDISFVLSRKFIISPTDVYSDGDTKSNTKSELLNGQKNNLEMTWAVANGWLATANTTNWDIDSKAMMTGCYAYQGKSGTDPRGTWRVPTYRELSMIMLFAHEIENTTAVTGFQKIIRAAQNHYGSDYWGASQGGNSKDYGSVGGLSLYGLPFGSASNSAYKTSKYRLRCVRDIP